MNGAFAGAMAVTASKLAGTTHACIGDVGIYKMQLFQIGKRFQMLQTVIRDVRGADSQNAERLQFFHM